MIRLIDTHAHLDHIEHLQEALDNALSGGVDKVVSVSTNTESCRKNLNIAESTRAVNVHVAMGMHPSDASADDLKNCLRFIREHSHKIIAIGEIGLDFWYKWVRKDKDKKDEQRKVFRSLLELAHELDLPAVIHTRGTWRECFETARDIGIKRAEFHWYSGPLDVLRNILDCGYYVSASPSLAYSPQSREAIQYAPISQTMIETDSPVFYRHHSPGCEQEADKNRGFLSQPKDVIKTLTAYCELRNTDQERAAEIFNRNAVTFFNLS